MVTMKIAAFWVVLLRTLLRKKVFDSIFITGASGSKLFPIVGHNPPTTWRHIQDGCNIQFVEMFILHEGNKNLWNFSL
jgi:hypothetical protein